MDLILATADGREERVMPEDIDLDCGSTNDFQVNVRYAAWTGDIEIGKLLYVPGTEYGGIVKDIESSTKTDMISAKGFTWRGYLDKRYIIPPVGQDYYIASGELHDIMRELIRIPGFSVPGKSTGITVTYQFNRFVTVLSGLSSMLASVGYRLDIRYVQTQTGGSVIVQAVPSSVYGDVDLSQDSKLDFMASDYQMGVNHLICLGKGELRDRIVVHLFADKAGRISRTQSIFGIDEICDTYENTSAEEADLISGGTSRLKELRNYKKFEASLKDNEFDLSIGDTITGRDYITGNVVTKPITGKILKTVDGITSITYKIEGES